MGPDLLRQRRNLLVVSLALIFSNLAGAEFNNKVAVMGTEITFARSGALKVGTWLLWAYFVGFHRSLTRDFHRILTHPLCEPEGFTMWINA